MNMAAPDKPQILADIEGLKEELLKDFKLNHKHAKSRFSYSFEIFKSRVIQAVSDPSTSEEVIASIGREVAELLHKLEEPLANSLSDDKNKLAKWSISLIVNLLYVVGPNFITNPVPVCNFLSNFYLTYNNTTRVRDHDRRIRTIPEIVENLLLDIGFYSSPDRIETTIGELKLRLTEIAGQIKTYEAYSVLESKGTSTQAKQKARDILASERKLERTIRQTEEHYGDDYQGGIRGLASYIMQIAMQKLSVYNTMVRILAKVASYNSNAILVIDQVSQTAEENVEARTFALDLLIRLKTMEFPEAERMVINEAYDKTMHMSLRRTEMDMNMVKLELLPTGKAPDASTRRAFAVPIGHASASQLKSKLPT